jgi:hypothetical protein
MAGGLAVVAWLPFLGIRRGMTSVSDHATIAAALDLVGPRLKGIRKDRGRPGERMHVRARSRREESAG